MRPHHRNPTMIIAILLLLGVPLAACSGSPSPRVTLPSAVTAPASGADAAGTVWLCRPGQADDPCEANIDTTSVPASGPRTVSAESEAPSSPFDCFYVYPTVSTETGDNADLTVQPAEIDTAVAQAAPFSTLCRVWAPIYRQRTVASLVGGLGGDPAADTVAYTSLLAGWNDYLAHDNDGRPVIFIGHSQGAAMLIRLLASQIDPNPTLRKRVVSAIIAGGNVTVPDGKQVGATFTQLPLCTASDQIGCVIAYSTFPSQPPANSVFGRPGQGVSLQSRQTTTSGVQVACVNPAALAGGTGKLMPRFLTTTTSTPPPTPGTPWVTYPDLYTASCHSNAGASWLQVDHSPTPGDTRPVVSETLGPRWGYHLEDINLALGNLVDDLQAQERAYQRTR